MNDDLGLFQEVRREPRKLICIPVLISMEGNDSFAIDYTTDMSVGGILIQTDRPFAVGTTLDIRFRLPGAIKLIEAKGKVVWSHAYVTGTEPTRHALPGMGIKFFRLDEQSRQYLVSYVEKEKGNTEEDIFIE